MAVYVNARFLSQPVTEVRRYAENITRALFAIRDGIRLLAPPGAPCLGWYRYPAHHSRHREDAFGDRFRHQSRLLGAVRYCQQLDCPTRCRASRQPVGNGVEKIRRYKLIILIIIDEVGYIPFDQGQDLTSNDVVAAAMIDRLAHYAEVLTLTGDSYRTRARHELLVKGRAGTS
jgi:hypothetical protein